MASAERTLTQLKEQGFHERVKNKEVLNGLGEIAAYMQCSIATIRRRIKLFGFPATAMRERTEYITTKTAIDKWISEGHLQRCIKYNWID